MAGNSASKEITKSVRLSPEQWRRVKRAARFESRRLGTRVYPTSLLAERGLDGIEEILAAAAAPDSDAA